MESPRSPLNNSGADNGYFYKTMNALLSSNHFEAVNEFQPIQWKDIQGVSQS